MSARGYSGRGYQPWNERILAYGGGDYAAGGIAPHVETSRWSYTVPANRIGVLVQASVLVCRYSTPTAGGPALAYVKISGTNAGMIVCCGGISSTSASGFFDNYSGVIFMPAGAILNGFTIDPSVGGSHLYKVSVQVCEILA